MSSHPVIKKGLGVPEAESFRSTLRAEDQVLFDQLYESALETYRMMTNVEVVIPFEKMLFAMLITQQREIDRLAALVITLGLVE
jgi:hypothetical protein